MLQTPASLYSNFRLGYFDRPWTIFHHHSISIWEHEAWTFQFDIQDEILDREAHCLFKQLPCRVFMYEQMTVKITRITRGLQTRCFFCCYFQWSRWPWQLWPEYSFLGALRLISMKSWSAFCTAGKQALISGLSLENGPLHCSPFVVGWCWNAHMRHSTGTVQKIVDIDGQHYIS